jgi:hypothetical protein
MASRQYVEESKQSLFTACTYIYMQYRNWIEYENPQQCSQYLLCELGELRTYLCECTGVQLSLRKGVQGAQIRLLEVPRPNNHQ